MIELVIDRQGLIRMLYADDFPPHTLGTLTISRASYVEPDQTGQWWADLAPVGGPKLGPHPLRAHALSAEQAWLRERLLSGPPTSLTPENPPPS